MDRIQAIYQQNKARSFTLAGGGDTVAEEILDFLSSEDAWKELFGSNYPTLPETVLWYFVSEAEYGIMWGGGDEVSYPLGISPVHYLNDLSQVQSAGAVMIVLNWSYPR